MVLAVVLCAIFVDYRVAAAPDERETEMGDVASTIEEEAVLWASEALKTQPVAPRPPIVVPTGEIQNLIVTYATQYGVSPSYLLAVAKCESGYNPGAYNPRDTDGLPAVGLFQYKTRTFNWFASESGLAVNDIWNPHHQAQLTAWAFANGLASHWGCA